LQQLRARNLDLVLVRIVRPLADDVFASDIDVEILFEDQLVVAAGLHSRWARRRHVELADLVDEPWILTEPNSWNTAVVADAFRAKGLKMPNISLATYSVHLRNNLLATGPFITAFPSSVLQLNANRFSLKVLPVDLPVKPWPVAIVTLKNRTLTPVAQRFIEHVRAYTKAMVVVSAPRKTPIRSARISSKVDAGDSTGNGAKHGMKAALKPRAGGLE
jgi:DNA-binding transcriptional LysR family regulator